MKNPIIGALLVCMSLGSAEPEPGTVRISLQDAYRLVIQNNLLSRAARQEREISDLGVPYEKGAFDVNLFADAGVSRTQLEDANPRSSGLGTIFFSDLSADQRTRFFTLGVDKLFATGTRASLSVSPGYASTFVQQMNHPLGSSQVTASEYGTDNPYGGRLTLRLDQPLLNGFGTTATEARLKEAKKRAEQGDLAYQEQLIRLIASTDSLYWEYSYALQNLKNKQEALDLASEQLSQDTERVKSGMLAPLDLPQVEATVAERRKDLFSAQAEVENTRLALMDQLYADRPRPSDLELTDLPTLLPFDPPLTEVERQALARRPELKLAAAQASERLIAEQAAKNRLLPKLDLTVAYTDAAKSGDALNPVLTELAQGNLPGYYLGLSFGIPISNRTARSSFQQARAAREEADLLSMNSRQTVLLDARQAYTALKAAEKEAGAAETALSYRQASLDAEMEKFKEGLSTSYFVLQRQDELDQARTALIVAQVSYRKAYTNLQRAMGTLLEDRLGPDYQ